MGKVWIIARRELAAFFFSPMAYAVGALFLLVCAVKFCPPPDILPGGREWFILVPGQQASLRSLFEMMGAAMIVAGPLLTMRLLSEEYRAGTVETMLTAPVSDTQVVLGKFLGVLLFYLLLLAGTGVFLLLMAIYAKPDPGVVATGYLGMVLLGMVTLAVGVFASTTTRYQLLGGLIGIAVLAVLTVLMTPAATWLPDPWNLAAARLNALRYLSTFARGTLDLRGVVYFLSLTAGFLFLSVKTLESRRWR